MKAGILAGLVYSLIMVACAAVPTGQISVSLAGSSWSLHAFQSMDDSQGTMAIDSPEKYSVTFNADGTAVFRLDCNRGRGEWESVPSPDGDGGSLRFGPVAITRALCPPPSMGEKLARDLGYVRSYRIADGKLYMALMADGGIYEWHPQ